MLRFINLTAAYWHSTKIFLHKYTFFTFLLIISASSCQAGPVAWPPRGLNCASQIAVALLRSPLSAWVLFNLWHFQSPGLSSSRALPPLTALQTRGQNVSFTTIIFTKSWTKIFNLFQYVRMARHCPPDGCPDANKIRPGARTWSWRWGGLTDQLLLSAWGKSCSHLIKHSMYHCVQVQDVADYFQSYFMDQVGLE